MTRFFSLFVFLTITVSAWAQPSNSFESIKPDEFRTKMAHTITVEDLQRRMATLAGDEMEGRETGTKGNELAAAYIAAELKRYTLKQVGGEYGYFQPMRIASERWEKIDMTVNDKDYRHLWDFYALHKDNKGLSDFSIDEIVFVGYGIEDEKLQNYKRSNVNGKAVIMYGGEPKTSDDTYLISGTSEPSEWAKNPMKKIDLAKSKGASAVFVISENFKENIANNRRYLMGPSIDLKPLAEEEESTSNFMYQFISPEMAKEMLGKKLKKVKKFRTKNAKGKSTKGLPVKTSVSGDMIKDVKYKETANVLGVLPGTDPQLKDEYIVVTAHFDHLGKRGEDIFNGADDNASGTSTVLELAEAFSTAKAMNYGLKRSVIFLLVSGEEKGLLGSSYYTDYPLVPLEQTMVNVNIDMVGRVDEEHEDPNYIYVIGADRLSTTLHDVNEEVNDRYEHLELDYTYNAEDDPNRYYYRSDHYNFARRGIPAVFFFNGTHKDYHRPSDTIEKIDYEKMAKIGRHIFHLIWELGNRPESIEVNVKQP